MNYKKGLGSLALVFSPGIVMILMLVLPHPYDRILLVLLLTFTAGIVFYVGAKTGERSK